MPSFSMTFALGLITSFLATATATNPSPPIAAATCYVDSCDTPSLPFLASKTTSQTVPSCIAECGAANFALAGLSWGDECFCGNELGGTASLNVPGSGLALPQTECNMPCAGDASTTCGGGFRLSVYTVPAVAKRTVRHNIRPSLEKRTCPLAPAPCYVDSCDNPSLPFLSSTSSTQTIPGCIAECGAANYKLAGLSWANECFCGNELGGTASLSTPGSGLAIPQTECNMPCAGDAGTICGGGFRLSLYPVPALARRNDGSTLRRSLERRTCPKPTSTVGPISTTPTATTSPAPSATCYVDSCDTPSLPFLSSTSSTQTVSGCIAECGAAGFKLAGLSWGNECFCGNELGGTAASNVPGSGLALPQTECNMPCTGDASSICGGGFRLSVYAVPAPTIKKRTARSNIRHSLERRTCPGASAPCYVDSCDNPALPFLSSKSPLQTVPRCIAECAAANYKLAGLSWADECFCGNELGGTAALTTPGSGLALPQTECNMPCAGDGGTICGGGFRLSLYTVPAPARRSYRPNFRRSLQKRTCPSSTSTLIGKPTASAAWRR
ncbi:WSC domain-containing protein [Mycena galopus ATCC 62051]|nr:WSC domain-containing protein [Mycena galopus ATCC 62051]